MVDLTADRHDFRLYINFFRVNACPPGGHGWSFAYSIYLCSGVLTWGLFTETLGNLVNVFLTNANILKKLSFPRICLPIIVTASAFINFLIIFGLFVLFLIVTGNFRA